MISPLTRRTVLQTGVVGVVAATAGCFVGGGGTEDKDVVVHNNRETEYRVDVVVERDSYFRKSRSARVSAGDTERLRDMVPSGDHPYPFLLETSVEGDQVKTTPHKWRWEDIIVKLQPDGTVFVSDVEQNDLLTTTTTTTTDSDRQQSPGTSTEPTPHPRTDL